MEGHFKKVKPRLISEQVFDQLRELIYRGVVKPGDKLLPERDLAREMNVSRATVRTAIQGLIDMGLVTHRQGKGTFVREYDDELKNPLAKALDLQNISLEKLLEVRLPLECNAAALAAKRADASDIKAIEHSCRQMVSENDQGRSGSQADSFFHMSIAYASKNPLQIMIIRNFYDYIFFGIKKSLESVYQDPGNIRRILEQHEQILAAIKSRDSEKASKAMETHVMFLIDFIGN